MIFFQFNMLNSENLNKNFIKNYLRIFSSVEHFGFNRSQLLPIPKKQYKKKKRKGVSSKWSQVALEKL